MRWLHARQPPGHMTAAVLHFKEAKARIDQRSSQAEISRFRCDTLNKIHTAWVLRVGKATMGEVQALHTVLRVGREAGARAGVFNSGERRTLVGFEPQIMNQDTRRSHGDRPAVRMSAALMKQAAEGHCELRPAHEARG
jgi:hypothetical protein